MIDKLEAIKARFDDLGVALTNPEIVGDNQKFKQVSKEYNQLEKIVVEYKQYKAILDDIDFNILPLKLLIKEHFDIDIEEAQNGKIAVDMFKKGLDKPCKCS